MPWLLGLSALFGTAYLLTGELRKSGLTPRDSQANEPTATKTLDKSADRLSSAAAAGLVIVAGAYAYSLVTR